MKRHFLTLAAAVMASSLLAAESNPTSSTVVGKWTSEFDTPVGHLKYVYALRMKDGQLSGIATREREGAKTQADLKEVSLNGDKLTFVEPIKIQDQDIRIEYKGKVSGDEIKFTRKVGEYEPMEIVARRIAQSSSSVAGKWNTEFDSQIGKQKYKYEFKIDGEKLTGKAIGESQFGTFDTAISEGKVTAEGVSFVEMLKLPDREIRIDYKGKMSGEDLKLTRKVGDIATEEIVAKRSLDGSEK